MLRTERRIELNMTYMESIYPKVQNCLNNLSSLTWQIYEISDAPIFVFIHGGYWQEGSKNVAAFAAPVLVRKGIKVITVGYDLCPNGKFISFSFLFTSK